MDNDVNLKLIDLVSRARVGEQESMSCLAELVKERLFAYIYRLTLDYDLAQDLLQETLLGMVESLKELERADRFWAWLFRTALGNVQHYFRDKRRRRILQMSKFEKDRLLGRIPEDYDDGLSNLVRKELSDAIFEAMKRLKLRYRSVLVLRCFEQMQYSEIADFMECNELQARVLFFRAKNSLRKQLSQRGFSKKFLLAGLALFGLITAPAKAASATSAVTAASLEVGLTAAAIGTAGTKLGIAAATAIAALTLTFPFETFLLVIVLLFFGLICFVVVLYNQ